MDEPGTSKGSSEDDDRMLDRLLVEAGELRQDTMVVSPSERRAALRRAKDRERKRERRKEITPSEKQQAAEVRRTRDREKYKQLTQEEHQKLIERKGAQRRRKREAEKAFLEMPIAKATVSEIACYTECVRSGKTTKFNIAELPTTSNSTGEGQPEVADLWTAAMERDTQVAISTVASALTKRRRKSGPDAARSAARDLKQLIGEIGRVRRKRNSPPVGKKLTSLLDSFIDPGAKKPRSNDANAEKRRETARKRYADMADDCKNARRQDGAERLRKKRADEKLLLERESTGDSGITPEEREIVAKIRAKRGEHAARQKRRYYEMSTEERSAFNAARDAHRRRRERGRRDEEEFVEPTLLWAESVEVQQPVGIEFVDYGLQERPPEGVEGRVNGGDEMDNHHHHHHHQHHHHHPDSQIITHL